MTIRFRDSVRKEFQAMGMWKSLNKAMFVLAAGAVVTKDIAPYSIIGGNPAKVIRHRQ